MKKLRKQVKKENKLTPRKVCMHCVHYRSKGWFRDEECRHPINLSLVDNQPVMDCSILRKYDYNKSCGEDGKWFEEKTL